MKKTLRVILITVLILGGLAIIFCPILIFMDNFQNQVKSTDIQHWGMFGDFFGGVTNTMISFVSLIVLAYISIVISKIGSDEHEKALIRERKREAYDKLSSSLTTLELTASRIVRHLKSIESKHYAQMVKLNDSTVINNSILTIETMINKYDEYHTFLFNFPVRYNQLFNIDLSSELHKEMITSSSVYQTTLNNLYEDLLNERSYKFSELSNAEKNM